MRAPILLILLTACSGGQHVKQPEICRNNVDDDNNGLADCDDPYCAFVCGEICNDGLDNDGDGKIDCADEGCDGQCPEVCDDGRDNDGDGLADCLDPQDCGGSCPETCDDHVDNDNDGQTDCDDPDCASTCDGDEDGYIAVAVGGDDCDDANADIHPGATETCDGADDDCNGKTDSADPGLEGAPTYYTDDDGDGFGDPSTAAPACEPPAEGVEVAGDCDDSNGQINPDAPEVCSGKDDDCDGLTDEDDPNLDKSTLVTWYPDVDGDGYGVSGGSKVQCTQPTGFADNKDDCDDTDAAVGPAQRWVHDGDGDGFGGGTPTGFQCDPPSGGGWVSLDLGLDCNDSNVAISPGAVDICGDGVDQDCDGVDFLGCYDTSANVSRFGGAQVDEVAGTYTGTETLSFVGQPSGWVICQWTWTMLDWDHDATAVGANPFVTPCQDPDGFSCDWSFTVHESDGHQSAGTDCAYYGLTSAAASLGGTYGYGWTDNYRAGGVPYGPSQMYFFPYTTGPGGTPITNTWLGLNTTFSNASYDQGTGTLSYDWLNLGTAPTP